MTKQVIRTNKAPAPIGPYSQAVEINGLLFLSGQIALDPATGKLMIENITAETNQIMKNIKAILETAGLSLGDIVKTSIFLSNMDDFKEVNECYAKYFDQDFPARETVEVSRLPKSVNLEISVIASRLK